MIQAGSRSTANREPSATITVPIPPDGGYGEIILKVRASFTNQIAASFDGVPIPQGAKAVVIKADGHVLYVSLFDDELNN